MLRVKIVFPVFIVEETKISSNIPFLGCLGTWNVEFGWFFVDFLYFFGGKFLKNM